MANALVTVATGTYQQLLDISGPLFQKYAGRIGAELIVIRDTTKSWWGLEKLRVQEICKRYDRTIFVDADIIIDINADNLFDVVPVNAIGMHDDYSKLAEKQATEWIQPTRDLVLSSQRESGVYPTVFNTGVIVASRMHANIWKEVHRPLTTHHCAEQFWVEHQCYINGYILHSLDETYNWQYWFRHFRTKQPQFKHYANCSMRNRLAYMRRDLCLQNAAAAEESNVY